MAVIDIMKQMLTTKGDVVVHNGTTAVRLAVGTDDHVLTADSAQAAGVKWAEVGGGGGSSATLAYKPDDESVSSADTGTTLQDDDDLVFAIGANDIWAVRYVLFPFSTDNGIDIKTNITVPTGATGRRNQFGATVAATTVNTFNYGQQFDLDGTTALSSGVGGGGSDYPLYLDAFVENGANAGNVTLQWAQITSSATALIMKKGSHLVAHQLA